MEAGTQHALKHDRIGVQDDVRREQPRRRVPRVAGERDHDHPGAERPENHVCELRHAGAPLQVR